MLDEIGAREFDFEFYSQVPQVEDEWRVRTETRLRRLAEGETDLIGASVAVETPAKQETPPIYKARVVVFARPDNVVAVEKSDTVETALRGALDAVERQIRERREKLRKPWQQP